jgi:hypothetical protein
VADKDKGLDWKTLGLWMANLLLGLIGFLGVHYINAQGELKKQADSDRIIFVEFMSRINTILMEPRFTEKNYNNRELPGIEKDKEQDRRLDRLERKLENGRE